MKDWAEIVNNTLAQSSFVRNLWNLLREQTFIPKKSKVDEKLTANRSRLSDLSEFARETDEQERERGIVMRSDERGKI